MDQIWNEDVFERLPKIEDNSVDMVLTDIPYLISKQTNFKSIKDFTKKTEGETDYSCMDFGDWDKQPFDVARYLKECCRILKPQRSIIVWCAWQQLVEVDQAIKSVLKSKAGSPRIGIWEKSNPSVFNMQRMAIQPIEFFVWHRKGSNWIFNNQNKPQAERHYFRHSCLAYGHPTAKPLPIFEHLIKTYTDEGQLVFDGLMGGGTTAVACLRTKRHYIGCERSKEWFELATKTIASHSL